jgi:hypothetical protein
MTVPSDPDRLIRAFLEDGTDELPARAFDEVRADIHRTRQRVVIGPWREPTMSIFARFGAVAAAVVLLVGAGWVLFEPSPSGVATPPTASPTSSPTTAPPAAPSSTPADRSLPEGSHDLERFGAVPLTVTIPARGWYAPGGGILMKNDSADPPDGAGMIVFGETTGYSVNGDPCRWSTTRSEAPATTVDDVVAALAAQASRDATVPVDITVDGYAGKSITLRVPDDVPHTGGPRGFTDCHEGKFRSWTTPSGERYHQGPGQIDKLWIVDVNGVVVVIDIAYYEGTPAAHVAELEAIVASITFR